MEAEVGAPALKPAATREGAAGAGGWMVSPAFDLLFLANLGWLLALVPGFVSAEGTAHLEFWQLYFLTTPHRWLTLGLVALDPDRREGRTGLFVALAVLAFVVVWGVYLTSGAFLCLALVDYLWNGWHFAAQHYGILRIYGRKAGEGSDRLERHGLRLFVFYVIARTAGWSTGWLEKDAEGTALLQAVDLAALSLPGALLAAAWLRRGPRPLPKLIYLTSVCGLYTALLLALHTRAAVLTVALTVASATFHAVEYLALVTSYAWRRQASGSAGLFQAMAGRWLGVLAAYVVLLGLADALLTASLAEWWVGMNLWAAFLHYTYDGMIWKLRRPATARSLGAISDQQPAASGGVYPRCEDPARRLAASG